MWPKLEVSVSFLKISIGSQRHTVGGLNSLNLLNLAIGYG